MLAGCCDGGIHSSTGFADVSNSRCRNRSLLRHRETISRLSRLCCGRGSSGENRDKYGTAPAGAGKQWRAERAGGQCRATGRHGEDQDRPDRRHDHARGARADRQPAKVLHVDHAGHSQRTSGSRCALQGPAIRQSRQLSATPAPRYDRSGSDASVSRCPRYVRQPPASDISGTGRHFAVGPNSEVTSSPRHVRFAPDSGRAAGILGGPRRARRRHQPRVGRDVG